MDVKFIEVKQAIVQEKQTNRDGNHGTKKSIIEETIAGKGTLHGIYGPFDRRAVSEQHKFKSNCERLSSKSIRKHVVGDFRQNRKRYNLFPV